MCINGFTILDPEMLSVGTGIYLGTSILDHSCEPNAVAVFHGTTINIRTLVDIPTLDFSKVISNSPKSLQLNPNGGQLNVNKMNMYCIFCKDFLRFYIKFLMTLNHTIEIFYYGKFYPIFRYFLCELILTFLCHKR